MQPKNSFQGLPTRSPARADRARSPFITRPSIPKPQNTGVANPPAKVTERTPSNYADNIYGTDSCSCEGSEA